MSGRQGNPSPVAIPQPSVPFLDPSGQVSRQWFYFLLGIFNRTGGSSTPVDITVLQKQVASLFVEEAMSDVPEPANLAPALLLAWMGDPELPAPLNPIIAALFVSDAA